MSGKSLVSSILWGPTGIDQIDDTADPARLTHDSGFILAATLTLPDAQSLAKGPAAGRCARVSPNRTGCPSSTNLHLLVAHHVALHRH